jgi:hypothetical protein
LGSLAWSRMRATSCSGTNSSWTGMNDDEGNRGDAVHDRGRC